MTTHSDTPYPQPPTHPRSDPGQERTFRELKEKEGVTSRRYAGMVHHLLTHKIKNNTATNNRQIGIVCPNKN